ncbi:putative transcriptional regulator, GntR family [Sulfolobus islandicus Y.G.57.14]|jgi:2-aminoadipate transaminase|uniref:GntR family transcriptional regulator n=5 Tax=Saccharolobus islandicus TaxID=43080 RepID=M9UB58_SACIS|nr:PLP-dependent aminotransferase family protein [Sulfolobus islandicus]ACP46395.1 putative transcriptional regulator, GntR family [Sulfolobus islandicus Y.G.57.14]ADB87930.1 aminotransferase, class I or II [Sulfolobus islandicus L.D.8.5]ADX83312.1 putative transcriptional regulator, GntR family [Sulfolobus islandicus HVE10/4]ADX85955.1 putative transcriptional regulator, GntR family [Sulfolobus islandicus REY15A]AGJ63318.1 GntR family transcriptional regulator [Sulfolobus islandicus LAL14/1]
MFERFLSNETKYLRTSEIRDLLKLTEGRNVISLAGGLPDPQTFPVEEIKKIVDDVLLNNADKALQYTATAGISEFRKELVNLSRLRGISGIDERNVFVTVGSQEALFMLFNILLDPGDNVIVEAPTYLAALNVMRTRKPNFISITVTERGPNLDELERKIRNTHNDGKKIKLMYVIPTAQNPAGTTMSTEDRKRLLEIASKYDFLIFEDDAYGFLVFEGESPPPIKAFDKEGRVIYTSTFSKILAPGLRLGWVIAHEDFIKEMELYKQNVDLHTPSFSQYIAMEAIRRGVIQNNLPKIRRVYKEKRDVILEAIETYFPKDARWTRPVGGMFVFAWLPEKIDTTKMLEKALQRGVAYVPGSSFYADYSGKNTMRINFSFPKKEELVEGIRRLGDTIKQELST